MPEISRIPRDLYLDGGEFIFDGEALYSIWPDHDGGYEAFLEPVAVRGESGRVMMFTRDWFIALYGEARVMSAEADALEAWLEHGPADLHAARSEQRYGMEVAR